MGLIVPPAIRREQASEGQQNCPGSEIGSTLRLLPYRCYLSILAGFGALSRAGPARAANSISDWPAHVNSGAVRDKKRQAGLRLDSRANGTEAREQRLERMSVQCTRELGGTAWYNPAPIGKLRQPGRRSIHGDHDEGVQTLPSVGGGWAG